MEYSGKHHPFSTLTCTGPQLRPAHAEVFHGDTEQRQEATLTSSSDFAATWHRTKCTSHGHLSLSLAAM